MSDVVVPVLVAIIVSAAPTLTALLAWRSQRQANAHAAAAARRAEMAALRNQATTEEVEHKVNSRLDKLLAANKILETEIRRLNVADASNTPETGREIGRPAPVTLGDGAVTIAEPPKA